MFVIHNFLIDVQDTAQLDDNLVIEIMHEMNLNHEADEQELDERDDFINEDTATRNTLLRHMTYNYRIYKLFIYLFIYYFHYPRVQAQLMAQLMTSVYILSISVLFCLFLSPSCPSCYLASPRVLHFYSFRSLDVCHCVFQGFHVAE